MVHLPRGRHLRLPSMTSCFSMRQDSVCARTVACSLKKPGCAVSPVASPGTSLNCCASGKESACQCRRCKRLGFNPWVEEIPWRRKWRPTPVFLSGDFHGQRSLAGYSPGVAQSQTHLSDGHTHSAPSAPRVRGRCAHAPAHKPSRGLGSCRYALQGVTASSDIWGA